MSKEESYQQLQAKLDALMVKLQDDDLDVDAAVATYEEATKVIKKLQTLLKQAENKLTKVKS